MVVYKAYLPQWHPIQALISSLSNTSRRKLILDGSNISMNSQGHFPVLDPPFTLISEIAAVSTISVLINGQY